MEAYTARGEIFKVLRHQAWHDALVRLIAVVLVLGGGFWGTLLAAICYRTDRPLLVAFLLGPGYLVTLAYGYRVFFKPQIRIRQCLWSFSILVQGAWLLWIVGAGLWENPPLRSVFQATLPSLWWTGATLSSILALFLETEDEVEGQLNHERQTPIARLESKPNDRPQTPRPEGRLR